MCLCVLWWTRNAYLRKKALWHDSLEQKYIGTGCSSTVDFMKIIERSLNKMIILMRRFIKYPDLLNYDYITEFEVYEIF